VLANSDRFQVLSRLCSRILCCPAISTGLVCFSSKHTAHVGSRPINYCPFPYPCRASPCPWKLGPCPWKLGPCLCRSSHC